MTSAAEAQQLLQQGRVAEAERAFRDLLAAEPENTQALNFLAIAAQRAGDMSMSRELIDRALKIDAANPMTLHNHGRLLQAAGRLDDAAAAQRAALRIAPHFHAARLYLGQVLELAGQTHQGVVAYARALQDAQLEGRWHNKSTTPPAFQPTIERAVSLVRRHRIESIERLLQPVMARHGTAALRRVEKSLRIFFQAEAPVVADPRQHSKFLHFPGIPARPYLDLNLFPWINSLEARASDIREELLALLSQSDGREPVFANTALEADHLRGLTQAPTWNGYYFYRYGLRRDDNCARCPKSAIALDALDLCKVPKHAPEVLFSVFSPGTHLLPHRGVTNTRVVAHLPLLVPDDCALVVGGEEHRWAEGKVVVFDDTFEHEAWNRSERTRVVLIFDLWSPFLTPAERDALAIMIDDIGDFRLEVESAD